MAYSLEIKNKIIERMKKEKITDISKDTGISMPTLYKWRKETTIANNIQQQLSEQKDTHKEEASRRYYNKQNEDFNFKKGLVCFKQKRYKEAQEYFSKSINYKGKDYNKSIFFLGKIYVIQRKYKEARKEFNKCIEIDKDKTPHARLELGRLDVKEGKYEEAREEFNKCIEIDKDKTPHARLELGRLDVIEGRYEEARKEFNKCIEIDKDNLHARLELGRLDVIEGRYEEARKEFNKYIEIDKDKTPHTRLELGRLDVIEGRYEEAREEFNKYIEIDKDKTPHARLELGRLDVIEGRYEEAREEFNKCIEIDKDKTPHARLELGRLDVKEERYEEAREEFNKYIEIDKDKTPHARLELERLINIKIENNQNNVLSEIRAKLWGDTIKEEDLARLEENKGKIDKKQYYFIKIAIYEKMGRKKKALQVIKEMEEDGISDESLKLIKERLKIKKSYIYDLGKWDEVIGWSIGGTEQYAQYNQSDRTNNVNSISVRNNSVSKEKKTDRKIGQTIDKKVTTTNMVKGYITGKSSSEEKNSKRKKINKSKKDKQPQDKKTIEQTLDETTKQIIQKIYHKYYIQMQPHKAKNAIPAEYYELLEGIEKTSAEEKKMRMQLMQDILKQTYGDEEKRLKFIRKYDRLQTVLECSTYNKRAKIELVLILINEGYDNVAQIEYKNEYNYILNLIKQHEQHKTVGQIKDYIDEYCL